MSNVPIDSDVTKSHGDSQDHSDPKHHNNFEYRSAIFESKSASERMRDALRNSPYFIISLAFNMSLLSFAMVWKLSHDESKLESASITAAIAKAADEDKPKDEEAKKKQIFVPEDALVMENDFDVTTNEQEIVFPDQSYEISDHNETANGEDFGQVKGNSPDFTLVNSSGTNLFDSIGIGGGAGRGGRGGAGTGFGGRFNRKVGPGGGMHTIRTETSVEAGLRWLARHQDENGAWSPDNFTKNCQGGTVCEHSKNFGYPEYETGTTSLALLAFLGAGYDHRTPKQWTDPFTKKIIRVGDVVKRGLIYLKDRQDEAGNVCEATNGKWGYNHSIAALALSEAYGLSHAPQFKSCAQKAINALVNGQNPAPGGTGLWAWRYRPQSGDNDISVTGWAVMALKSAELAGLVTSQSSMEGAFNFCEEVTDKGLGLAGYTKREEAGQQVKAIGKNDDCANHQALSAVGMCVRTFVKHNPDDPMLEKGAKALVNDLPVWDTKAKKIDYYYWYYASIALNQFDGPESPRAAKGAYWKPWESALQKALLDNQVNNTKLCSDGSWAGDDRWGVDGGGRVYGTAINTLTFEVYYRYGNAFGLAKKVKVPGAPAVKPEKAAEKK
ncbi:MAG: terpene cyclase/mutase family protein [Planctomycetes bacterium]|nr:terpene cyclase/mutase family protein [Planctomycetota bacterium]